MDKETGNALRELLQTMGEALGHLHNHENEELRQMVPGVPFLSAALRRQSDSHRVRAAVQSRGIGAFL